MSVVVLVLIAAALIVPALYMMFLERLTKDGPEIEIRKLFIEEKTESAGLAWFKWYVVHIEYFVEGYPGGHVVIGPDKRSSWFKTEAKAREALNRVQETKTAKITPFGSLILSSRLSTDRLSHYVSMLASGGMLLVVTACIAGILWS